MAACQQRLPSRPALQTVATAISGFRGRSPLFAMITDCQKRLKKLELALLYGKASRKAAGALALFTKTIRIALD